LPKSSTYFLPFEKLIAVKSMLAARALPKFEKVPDQCEYLFQNHAVKLDIGK